MGQCGLWPQEGSRGVRTDVELYKARFTLVIKDVLSDAEKSNRKKTSVNHAKWKLSSESLRPCYFVLANSSRYKYSQNNPRQSEEFGNSSWNMLSRWLTHMASELDAGSWLSQLRTSAFGFFPPPDLYVVWAADEYQVSIPERICKWWLLFSWSSLKVTCVTSTSLIVKAVTQVHPVFRTQMPPPDGEWQVLDEKHTGKYSYIHSFFKI